MVKVQEFINEQTKTNSEYKMVLDYFKENSIWFTRHTNIPMKLEDMSDTHIRNCIHVMEDALEDGAESELRREYYEDMLPVMKEEYDMRKEKVADDESLSEHNAGCMAFFSFSKEM